MDYNNIFEKYGNSTCLGLENGRCGLVLLAFLLSEKDEKYKEKAFLHLEYLIEYVYESSCLSFRKGLLGIGWTLEFLTQNLYLSVSHDALLSEIDDIIYKWVNFHGLTTISINDGYLGCLLYLCYRLKGNRISTPYRELSLKECTVRLLGQIHDRANRQEITQFTNIEWRQLHVLAGFFKRMNIQNHITTDLLQITKNMVKRDYYIVKSHKNGTIDEIYLLCKASKNHKVVANFFMQEQN